MQLFFAFNLSFCDLATVLATIWVFFKLLVTLLKMPENKLECLSLASFFSD
jgi:hypothetical protein